MKADPQGFVHHSLQIPSLDLLSPIICSSPSTASSLSTVSLVETSSRDGGQPINIRKPELTVPRTTPHCPWSPTVSSFARHSVPIGKKHVLVLPNLDTTVNSSSQFQQHPTQPIGVKSFVDHPQVDCFEDTHALFPESNPAVLSPGFPSVSDVTESFLRSEDGLIICEPHLETSPTKTHTRIQSHHGNSHTHARRCKHRCAASKSRKRTQTRSTTGRRKCREDCNPELSEGRCEVASRGIPNRSLDVQGLAVDGGTFDGFVRAKEHTLGNIPQSPHKSLHNGVETQVSGRFPTVSHVMLTSQHIAFTETFDV